MKIVASVIAAGTVAAISFGASVGLYAQNADRDQIGPTAQAADQPSSVTKLNKASSLIGLEVRNLQNEKLGEIKDLALDLPTGKVGYAVLSVGGFLGLGDKYIAVPPSALSPAPDQECLVLNADKAKIQSAPGFARNNWPDPNNLNATAISNYWIPDGPAQGTAGPSATSGTSSSSGATWKGRIIAVDPDAKSIAVKTPEGIREFKLSAHPTITRKNDSTARLSDLKVGSPVVVAYHEDNGKFVADSLAAGEPSAVK